MTAQVYHGGGSCRSAWPLDSGSIQDIKAKVTANDTTTNYLDSKIAAGAGITKSVLNPGVNEQLSIACSLVVPTLYQRQHIYSRSFETASGSSSETDLTYSTAQVRFETRSMVQNTILSTVILTPENWDTLKVYCTSAFIMSSNSSASTHTFTTGVAAYSNGEAVDVAFNLDTSFQFITDNTAGKLYYVTYEITPQSSPVAGCFIAIKMKRTDDESGDVNFIGTLTRFKLT